MSIKFPIKQSFRKDVNLTNEEIFYHFLVNCILKKFLFCDVVPCLATWVDSPTELKRLRIDKKFVMIQCTTQSALSETKDSKMLIL